MLYLAKVFVDTFMECAEIVWKVTKWFVSYL